VLDCEDELLLKSVSGPEAGQGRTGQDRAGQRKGVSGAGVLENAISLMSVMNIAKKEKI